MRNFLYRAGDGLRRFMTGRNGLDAMSMGLMVTGLILSFIIGLFRLSILSPIPSLLYVWALFRCLSKNIPKRRAELEKYFRLTANARSTYRIYRNHAKDKEHRYIRCRSCRTMMRVPRGKGKIKVTCPNCHQQSVRRS